MINDVKYYITITMQEHYDLLEYLKQLKPTDLDWSNAKVDIDYAIEFVNKKVERLESIHDDHYIYDVRELPKVIRSLPSIYTNVLSSILQKIMDKMLIAMRTWVTLFRSDFEKFPKLCELVDNNIKNGYCEDDLITYYPTLKECHILIDKLLAYVEFAKLSQPDQSKYLHLISNLYNVQTEILSLDYDIYLED